jgi:hypothetical protein
MRVSKILLLLATSALLFLSTPAMGIGPGYEYMIDSPSVTLQWDAIPEAAAYRIRVIMFDKVPETTYATGITTESSMPILRPRSGHFRFEAQACRLADCSVVDPAVPENDLSDWARSDDVLHGVTDLDGDGTYEPMAWWVYWKTPPPIVLP